MKTLSARLLLSLLLLLLASCEDNAADDECQLLTAGTDFAPTCTRLGPARYRKLAEQCAQPDARGTIGEFSACIEAGSAPGSE